MARWLYLSREIDDGCVVLLHDKPAIAAFRDRKRSDLPLHAVLHAIGRRKWTHYAGHRCNCHIGRGKSDVHVFYRVGRALEKRLMHLVLLSA